MAANTGATQRLRDDADAVFEAIASGRVTIRELVERYDCSRKVLYAFLREQPERWEEAKRISADVLVEEATEILDDPSSAKDNATAKMAVARAGHRKWLAGKRSEEYDDKPPQVNVGLGLSVGELHLDALHRMGHATKHAPALEQEADYEVVEEQQVLPQT